MKWPAYIIIVLFCVHSLRAEEISSSNKTRIHSINNDISWCEQKSTHITHDPFPALSTSTALSTNSSVPGGAHVPAEPGPWNRYKIKVAHYGWGVAACILLWKFLEQWILKVLYFAGRWLYSRLAGKCIARSVALRTYNNTIIKKYETIKIPFRPYQSLQMDDILVPLMLNDRHGSTESHAFETIRSHKTMVITGLAGSGKSLLLKNCALLSARGNPVVPQCGTAVFIKLHRLSKSESSFEDHLVMEFKRNAFPHAQGFIKQGLKEKQFMILLDGFDEIRADTRPVVAQKVKDFISYYPHCTVIITCRTDVYQGEFDDSVEKIYDIAPLKDYQIRQFLASWVGDMPASKTIEHLITTLQERPHIVALARNPLMLTLIAYLYTDTPYALPHRGAEFFLHSTDLLLRQWNQRNQFEANHKRLILQKLALVNQDRAGTSSFSHRSIDYEVAMKEVNSILIHLNLNSEYTQSILDEIAERSGLLIEIKEGHCYQFAHMTLQEFFAASALLDDEQGLLRRFNSNPELWRKPVKLWCGLSDNCTEIIKNIYEHDPLTAFECLHEAQEVDNTVTEEIVTAFKSRLNKEEQTLLVTRAFGALAADAGTRGQGVLTFLVQSLNQGHDEALCFAAAQALAYTNLPAAARWIALILYCSDTDLSEEQRKRLRSSLTRMGDLAVNVLAPLAEFGELLHSGDSTYVVAKLMRNREEVFDDLLTIATPRAASALLQFLWYPNESLAFEAAWRLAALLQNPSVEKSLRTVPIIQELRNKSQIQWVWEPFNEPANSSLPVITGRIFSLIVKSVPEKIDYITTHLDVRIVVPLIIELQSHINFSPLQTELRNPSPELIYLIKTLNSQSMDFQRGNIEADNSISQLKAITTALHILDTPEFKGNTQTRYQFVQELLKSEKSPLPELMELLKPEFTFAVLKSFFHDPPPTYQDWRTIFLSCTYEFSKSFHFRLILVFMALLSLLCLGEVDEIFGQSPVIITVTNTFLFFGALSILASWYFLWQGRFHMSFHPYDFFNCSLSPLLIISHTLKIPMKIGQHISQKKYNELWRKSKEGTIRLLNFIPCIGFAPSLAYLITVMVNKHFSGIFTLGWWLTLGAVMFYLIRKGLKKERACANPLRTIVKKPHWMKGLNKENSLCKPSRKFYWFRR